MNPLTEQMHRVQMQMVATAILGGVAWLTWSVLTLIYGVPH